LYISHACFCKAFVQLNTGLKSINASLHTAWYKKLIVMTDINASAPGPKRFACFLNQMQPLLAKAAKQKKPGLWLYRNNLRTPLFMLEGLSRMYATIHNPKRFTKLKEQFKLLEDLLGGVDYYAAFADEFAKNKKIPAAVVKLIKAGMNSKLAELNSVLADKGWLDAGNRRINKITQKLAGADWLDAAADMEAVKTHYADQTAGISGFVNDLNFHFDNMEEDVHELRRRLRWLSIYPQALCGSIQLSDSKPKAKHLAKYLTKEILGSPYNVMPAAAGNEYILSFEKNYFYALSWTIAELGKLKDNGLRIHILIETLCATAGMAEAEAYKKTHQLLGSKYPSLPRLLDTAENIAKTFFAEKNLDKLVKGITKNK
jgi:hypothetical protein